MKVSFPLPLFFNLVAVFFLFAIALSWFRYVKDKSYWLYAKVDCDESDSGRCFFNADEEQSYRVIYYLAEKAPTCLVEEGGCSEPLSCPNNADYCRNLFCSEETLQFLDLTDQCLE